MKLKQAKRALFGLAVTLAGLVLLRALAATGASFSLAPSTQSVLVGSRFTVEIRVGAADGVDYARAIIQYPANLLQAAAIDTSGSAFNTDAGQQIDNVAGRITVTRYSTAGPKAGDLLLAKVTFAATAPGVAQSNFAAGTYAADSRGGGQPSVTTSGGTYTISQSPSSPPAPAPVSEPPSPPSGFRPNGAAAPTRPSSPSGPPAGNSPTVGGPLAGEGNLPTPNSEAPSKPVPARLVKFRLKRGTRPVAGATVTVAGASRTTNKQGEVTFDLPPGRAEVTVYHAGSAANYVVQINDAESNTAQDVELFLPAAAASRTRLPGILNWLLAAVAIGLGGGAWLYWRSRGHRWTDNKAAPATVVEATTTQPVNTDLSPLPAAVMPIRRPDKDNLHPHTSGQLVGTPRPEPPRPVNPFKETGEPKDIYEIAEERFKQDDRLRQLR